MLSFVQTALPHLESLRPGNQPPLQLRSEHRPRKLVPTHKGAEFLVDQNGDCLPHRQPDRFAVASPRGPRRIREGEASTQLTKDDVKALVASLRDITATLAAADPTDKAAVYEEMGIDVTYHQDGQVLVESRPRVVSDGVGGGT